MRACVRVCLGEEEVGYWGIGDEEGDAGAYWEHKVFVKDRVRDKIAENCRSWLSDLLRLREMNII